MAKHITISTAPIHTVYTYGHNLKRRPIHTLLAVNYNNIMTTTTVLRTARRRWRLAARPPTFQMPSWEDYQAQHHLCRCPQCQYFSAIVDARQRWAQPLLRTALATETQDAVTDAQIRYAQLNISIRHSSLCIPSQASKPASACKSWPHLPYPPKLLARRCLRHYHHHHHHVRALSALPL